MVEAPKSVYLMGGVPVPLHKAGELKIDNYPALKLAEYGNNILGYFYLDGWALVRDKNGNEGFVGYVENVPGSVRYRMHADRRFSKGLLTNEVTGVKYRLLNDAGLNTLGKIVIYPESSRLTPEGLYLSVAVLAAYYVDTTNYGIGGLYVNDYVPAGQVKSTEILVGLVDTGQTYHFWGMNQNAEGTYNSDTFAYLVPRLPRILTGPGDYPSGTYVAWLAGDRTTFYQDVGQNNENGLHTNPTGANKPPQGYYTDGIRWFYLNSEGVFSESGQVGTGHWPPGDPLYIAPYTEY